MKNHDFKKLIKKMDPSPRTSGKRIRAVRNFLGLTLKEVEEVTGISTPNLSAIENDRLEISKKYAEILGAALGLHPMEILYPDGEFHKDDKLIEVESKAQRLLARKAAV